MTSEQFVLLKLIYKGAKWMNATAENSTLKGEADWQSVL